MCYQLCYESLSDKHKNQISNFDCGDDGLNNFIKENAIKDNPLDCKGTTTIIMENNNMVGYYTLKNTSLLFKPDQHLRGIPSIEITYFAIDKNYQRRGIGSTALQNIVYQTYKYSDIFSATKVLVVSSLIDKEKFYKKNNFQNFSEYFDLPYDECRSTTKQLFLNLHKKKE